MKYFNIYILARIKKKAKNEEPLPDRLTENLKQEYKKKPEQ